MIFGASLRKSFSYGMFVSKRFKIVLFWFGAEIRFWGNNNFCCPSVACTSTAFCSSVSAARGGVAASRFLDAAVRIEVFPKDFQLQLALPFLQHLAKHTPDQLPENILGIVDTAKTFQSKLGASIARCQRRITAGAHRSFNNNNRRVIATYANRAQPSFSHVQLRCFQCLLKLIRRDGSCVNPLQLHDLRAVLEQHHLGNTFHHRLCGGRMGFKR